MKTSKSVSRYMFTLLPLLLLGMFLGQAIYAGVPEYDRKSAEDFRQAQEALKSAKGKAKTISQLGPDWNTSGSSGVAAHPTTLSSGSGWILAFPRYDADASAPCWSVAASVCGWLGYLTTPYTTPPVQGQTLTMSVGIATNGPATFLGDTEQGNTCPSPATFRFFIQQSHDNYSKDGYRWWSNPVAFILAPGQATVSVAIDPSQWSGIFGERANQDATTLAMWNAALANIGNIGGTFGAGCFFGHGVYVSGADATITVYSYTIQ